HLGPVRVHCPQLLVQVPAHRQPFLLLPPLHGADVALKVSGDLLPGLQLLVRGVHYIPTTKHGKRPVSHLAVLRRLPPALWWLMRFLLCLFGFSLLLPAQNVLLTSGVAAPFSFPAVNSPTIFYRDFGYRVEVPAGATRLEVRLGSIPSSVQFAIALRFGQDITNPPLSSDYPVIVG